jgi:uncharacterized protein (TIGR03086 family)
MTDLRACHREATEVARAVVGAVGVGDLRLATPCAGWDLGRLLAHMTGQNHGFAASARGETADLGIWADRPVGAAPATVFGASADAVLDAFADPGADERGLWLPEIRTGGIFPSSVAIGFHLVDTVVHAWDVAKSLGAEVEFSPEVLAAALRPALAVPDGDARLRDGAAFAPAVGAGEQAATLDRVLAALGRDPQWAPPAPS